MGRTLHRPANPATFDRAPWAGGLNFDVNFDYSYDGIMRSYEQALQRLALDTVDALVIHDLDSLFHDEQALADHARALSESGMKALEELKSSGDIRAIGMGINRKEQLVDLAQTVDLDFVLVAMPYTLMDQEALHTGMKACLERNVSVIVGAPFASGILGQLTMRMNLPVVKSSTRFVVSSASVRHTVSPCRQQHCNSRWLIRRYRPSSRVSPMPGR